MQGPPGRPVEQWPCPEGGWWKDRPGVPEGDGHGGHRTSARDLRRLLYEEEGEESGALTPQINSGARWGCACLVCDTNVFRIGDNFSHQRPCR